MTAPRRPRWILPAAAVGALIATAIFYAGVMAIPGITRGLMQQRFAERITMEAVPSLIERRERLDEARRFLDSRIEDGTIHDMIYAYRGRLEAAIDGPEAGFFYLADLLSGRNLNELVGGWLELARLAGLAQRWDDFFNLGMLLSDYGEQEALQALIVELRQAGAPVNQALLTPEGIRFLVYAGWEAKSPMQLAEDQPEARAALALWRAEQEIRFDRKFADPLTSQTLQQLLPDDPRAEYLLDYHRNAARQRHVPEVFRHAPILRAQDFLYRGKPLQGNVIAANGEYQATLDKPLEGPLWMLCTATPVLHVFPLVYIHLDDELSIHYLPYPRPFPVKIQRRDGKPFKTVRIEFVNDLTSERLKQDRNITVHGFY